MTQSVPRYRWKPATLLGRRSGKVALEISDDYGGLSVLV